MNNFRIVVNTSEPTVWYFPENEIRLKNLDVAGYSVENLENYIAIHRRSLPHIVHCIGAGRDKFKKLLLQTKGFRCRAVIIEANLDHIINNQFASSTNPESVIGSLASWQNRFEIPFIFAGPDGGARYCLALMRTFVSQMREFMKTVNLEQNNIPKQKEAAPETKPKTKPDPQKFQVNMVHMPNPAKEAKASS